MKKMNIHVIDIKTYNITSVFFMDTIIHTYKYYLVSSIPLIRIYNTQRPKFIFKKSSL